MLHMQGRVVSIMVLYCVILHLGWAVGLLLDPSAVYTTPVYSLYQVFGAPPMLSFVLALVALAAGVAVIGRSPWAVLLMLPQQILLMISADGVLLAIWHSAYADGVERSRAFIAVDQWGVIIAAIFHPVAMLAYALGWNRR
jgi:hypothetical protein